MISGSRSNIDLYYGLCNAHGHGTHWAHLAILGIFTGKNGESQYAGDITLKYIDQELLPEVKLIWRSWSQLQKRARVELFWLSVFAAVDLGDLVDLRLVTCHYERGACANFRKKERTAR